MDRLERVRYFGKTTMCIDHVLYMLLFRYCPIDLEISVYSKSRIIESYLWW